MEKRRVQSVESFNKARDLYRESRRPYTEELNSGERQLEHEWVEGDSGTEEEKKLLETIRVWWLSVPFVCNDAPSHVSAHAAWEGRPVGFDDPHQSGISKWEVRNLYRQDRLLICPKTAQIQLFIVTVPSTTCRIAILLPPKSGLNTTALKNPPFYIHTYKVTGADGLVTLSSLYYPSSNTHPSGSLSTYVTLSLWFNITVYEKL